MSGELLEPGTLLNDRYRILRVIGRGGMGTVYQAQHVRLDTVLAVKEVRAPQTADADSQALLAQCEHEARFLVRLHHPNLPQVTDAFLENDRFFVVMEYIEGVTLEARERAAGPAGLPVPAVIDWGLQVADVLAYLHSQDPPIIFRDLKPANVMVQADGRVRLIDFGIARRFQPGAVKDTNLLGSVGYSPPEQFGRHQTDTRTDIYAFGATLHNLLTGRDPSHSPFKFTAARTLNPAVPETLSRLIDRCLRIDADARPQTIHEVAMELLGIRDTLPASVVEPPVPNPAYAEAPAPPTVPSGPKIILTNPTLRNTGKTVRNPTRIGSAPLGSEQLVSQGLVPGAVAGAAVAPAPAAPVGAPSGAVQSGALPDSGAPRALWLAGIGAAALLGAFGVWFAMAGSRHPGKPAPRPVADVRPVAPQPNSDPGPAQPDSPVTAPRTTPSDSGSAPITTFSRAVTFDSVSVKGVVQDAQGHATLQIEAVGTAEGQPGDQEIIAAFFYDAQNTQIASQLPQTPYSSKDGKLSSATTLTLTTPRQPFDLTLTVPVAAFPPGLTGAVQFHCVAFYGDQRIGESKTYTPIDTTTLAPAPGAPANPPVTPPDSGGGTSTSGPAVPPGTIHSSPIRGGD